MLFASFQQNDNRRSIRKAVFFSRRSGGKGQMMTSRFGVVTLAFAGLAITACAKKDSGAVDTTAASSTVSVDTSAMAGSATTSGTWADANIFALLDEANMADSAAGALAATKGTSSAVRDFGRRMTRDHHTLRAKGEALAKKLKITPTPPGDDNLVADAQKNMDNLNSTAKGKDFDKAYVDSEVDVHKKVLDLATKAMGQAQSTELKNLIQQAAPVIKGHLDLAESIQKNLK
jgi:putative membrane protein